MVHWNIRNIRMLSVSIFTIFFQTQVTYAIGFESMEEGHAFENGNLRLVKKIIEKDNFFKERENLILVQALYLAVGSGNLDLIKYLDSKGWLAICHKEKNCFPLHYAASLDLKTSLPMVKFFMAKKF